MYVLFVLGLHNFSFRKLNILETLLFQRSSNFTFYWLCKILNIVDLSSFKLVAYFKLHDFMHKLDTFFAYDFDFN